MGTENNHFIGLTFSIEFEIYSVFSGSHLYQLPQFSRISFRALRTQYLRFRYRGNTVCYGCCTRLRYAPSVSSVSHIYADLPRDEYPFPLESEASHTTTVECGVCSHTVVRTAARAMKLFSRDNGCPSIQDHCGARTETGEM